MGRRLVFLLVFFIPTTTPSAEPEVVARDRFGDPMPPGAVARLGSVRLRHLTVMGDAHFSPDGAHLLTVGGPVYLWDRASGRLLTQLSGVSDEACFTADGEHVLSSRFTFNPLGDEFHRQPLDGGKGERLWIQHEYRGSPRRLVCSPDGTFLAVYYATRKNGNDFDRVYLFDLKRKTEHRLIEKSNWSDVGMVFSPDGKQLFVYRYPYLQTWNVNDRTRASEIHIGSNTAVMTISRDGARLAIPGFDAPVNIVQTTDAKPRVLVCDPKTARAAAVGFSADGKELFVASGSGDVIAIDPTTRKLSRVVAEGKGDDFAESRFSPDGRWLMQNRDGAMTILDTQTGKPLHEFDDHRGGGAFEVAVTSDGERVATRSGREVRQWELRTGKMLRRLEVDRDVLSLRWSGDGKFLVAGQPGGKLTWYDAVTGKSTRSTTLTLPAGTVQRLTLLAGDARASCQVETADGTRLLIFDLEQPGKPLLDRPVQRGAYESPDGKYVHILDYLPEGDREVTLVRLFDVLTGKMLWEHQLAEVQLASLFSPRGDRLMVKGKTVLIWDVATGKPIAEHAVSSRLGSPTFLGLSPDGRTLVVKARIFATESGPGASVSIGSARDHLHLVNAATGEVQRTLPPTPAVVGIAFTRDGKHLITGHGDGHAIVWDVAAMRK